MIVFALRTDSPETYISISNGLEIVSEKKWESGRQLASELLSEIDKIFKTSKYTITDIEGIVCYEGPGSFTGLRIGITVGNTFAYSMRVPIVGTTGIDWLTDGVNILLGGEKNKMIMPLYGSEAHITL